MTPAEPADTRINFIPPVASVFVVDNAKGQISSAIRHKDNKIQVVHAGDQAPPNGKFAISLKVVHCYCLPIPAMPDGVLSWMICAARSRISSS